MAVGRYEQVDVLFTPEGKDPVAGQGTADRTDNIAVHVYIAVWIVASRIVQIIF